MSNKIKLAILRGDGQPGCPFGLSIPEGCSTAGDIVNNMATLASAKNEEELKNIKEDNNYLLRWRTEGYKCIYNRAVFDDKVNCGFEDGIDVPTTPAMSYDKNFSHMGLTGITTYPTINYFDSSIDRGYYYGAPYIESVGSKKEK